MCVQKGINILNEMINGSTDNGVVAEENEEVENIDVVDVETSVTTGKRKATLVGSRGPKWKSLEDECPIDAWKEMSLGPTTGANQTSGKYYNGILDQFNKHQHIREYGKIHMIWNEGAISHW
jgi:hypothetical protein